MEILATFYTHYGAMRFDRFCREEKIAAQMAPVPRELSSSCGVCVRFESVDAPVVADHEDMERCYIVAPDGEYTPIEG